MSQQGFDSRQAERAIAPARFEAPQPPRWGRALYRVLAGSFWVAGRLGFDVRTRGFEHYTNRPATLIVCNHKTDSDIMLLVPTLRGAHRAKGPVARLSFMAAERMFQPNYFSTYVLPHPRWLSRVLYSLDISTVLRALRSHPLPHARTRKLRAHLRELLALEGNLPLTHVFRQPLDALIPGAAPDARIADVLGWRHREALDLEHGFSIFRQPLANELRKRHRERVSASLALFAGVLEVGDPLYIAPEGDLSPDGRLGKFKAGLAHMVDRVERDLTLLPVQFTYDVMTTGRPTAFLSIGPECRDLGALPGEDLNAEIRRRILQLGTVTLGQLAARALRMRADAGFDCIRIAELRNWIDAQAQELAQQGLHVDECLLQADRYARRWRRFLAYCQRQNLLRRAGEQLVFDPQVLSSGLQSANASLHSWRYQENELDDSMSVAGPGVLLQSPA